MPLPTKVNVARPESWGYDALIEYGDSDAESLYLRLAAGPGRAMQLQTVEVEERGVDTAANPEDMRGESGETFSRSDFTGGEGLDRAHRRNGTPQDWSRYWDSRNIDITPSRAGEAEEIKLLHSASSLRAMAAATDRGALVRIGTVLYGLINSATQVDRTNNPTAASPTWTQSTPGGSGDIADLAGLGDKVYAAQDTIRVRDAATAVWSLFTDLDADRLWAAKGRILASVGPALYEARSGAGNSVLIHTLPSGQTWNDTIDAGGAILAAASDGHVYVFAEQAGDLVLKGQTLFPGEVPTALGWGQGLVFIGTGEVTTTGGTIGRLYRSVLVGLRLRESQVLRQWGDGSATLDHAPRRIIATREAIYTGVIEDATETHLWKYHLETGGLSRDLILGNDGLVHGLAVVDNRMFATVFGDALWRENTTYASSGYIIGPLADFYSAARKAWVGGRLQTSEVPTDTQVVLAYSTDPAALENPAHASWADLITATPAAPGAGEETAITEVQSRYLAGKLTLTPNPAATSTPTVLAYAFRALAIPTEVDFSLPVNISDRLELPGKKPLTVNGVGDQVYEALSDLIGQSVTVTLLRPDETLKGQLRTLSSPIQQIPRRGSPTVYALLTVRGQRQ